MATDRDDTEFSCAHTSPSDLVLTELQPHGYRPFQDEPDPRPLPEGNAIAGAVADIFDALIATLSDTRLEPDLTDLLWSTVNLFHRAADRVPQKRSQTEQDGSEIRSVELERLAAEGLTSNAATAWSSSATSPPTSSNATRVHSGVRAPALSSTTARGRQR